MKSILLSIKPQFVAKILNGEKTIEIRKHAIPVGTKVYIYCTIDKYHCFDYGRPLLGKRYMAIHRRVGMSSSCDLNGKVVASFVVSKCDKYSNYWDLLREDYLTKEQKEEYKEELNVLKKLLKESCLNQTEICCYADGHDWFYAWHISQLKIFDRPKELLHFNRRKKCDSCKYYCKHCFRRKGDGCMLYLNKAPQSYCYVEELK